MEIVPLIVLLEPRVPASGWWRCVNPGGTDGCYASIQTAINASAYGDSIHVWAGTYLEHIILTDGVSIYGAGWDKTIIRIYTVLLMVMYIVLPLDAVRFGWSRVPAAISWLAFSGIFLSWAVVFWAFRENAYLSAFVRVQTDRGHTVCTTGPYRFVRHPMYLAVILAILCVPLFLGSLFSLIPAVLIVGLFVLRTSLEDRTLRAELPGYADYAAKVRWKLIPNVW